MTGPDPGDLLRYAQQVHQSPQVRASSLVDYGQHAHKLLLEAIQARNGALQAQFRPSPGLMDAADLDFTPDAHRRLIAWMLDPVRSGQIAPLLWQIWTDDPTWRGKLRVGRGDLHGLDLLAWDDDRQLGLALAMTNAEETTRALSAQLDASVYHALHTLGVEARHKIVWLYVTPSGTPPQSAWNTRTLWRSLSWGAWRQLFDVFADALSLEDEERAFVRRYQHLLTRHLLTDPHSYQLARQAWHQLQEGLRDLDALSMNQLYVLHHELCTLGRIFHTGPR